MSLSTTKTALSRCLCTRCGEWEAGEEVAFSSETTSESPRRLLPRQRCGTVRVRDADVGNGRAENNPLPLPPSYHADPRKPRAAPLVEPISAREANAIATDADDDYSALDVLAFCCDDISSPGGVPPPVEGGGEVRFAGARVRRRVTLWAVGRATVSTAVQSLSTPDSLDPTSSSAARLSRASLVFGASAPAWLARAGAGWGAAATAAHARALARDTATRTAALQLFDSTAKNGGPSDVGVGAGGANGVVASALSRALAAAAAGETDCTLPALRAALGYVWTLARIAADSAKRAGEKPEWDVPAAWGGATGDTRVEEDDEEDSADDAGESQDGDSEEGCNHSADESGVTLPLGSVLCALAAAAWHWPLIRWVLRPLFSLDSTPSVHLNKMCVLLLRPDTSPPAFFLTPFLPPRLPRYPTSGPLAAAKAVLPKLRVALLRTLLQSKPGSGSSPRAIARREARSRVTFTSLVDAASTLSSHAPSLDLLFPLLAYVREGTGGGGAGAAVCAGEHISDALVRRRVLPWDPRELEALGVGDTTTRSALGSAALCATPIDAFAPREAAFLLADAPAVATLAPAALGALASSFAGAHLRFLRACVRNDSAVVFTPPPPLSPSPADPAAALSATLAMLRREADDLYLRRAPVGGSGDCEAPTSSAARLAAHARLVRVASVALSPALLPTFARSVKAALSRAARTEASSNIAAIAATAFAKQRADDLAMTLSGVAEKQVFGAPSGGSIDTSSAAIATLIGDVANLLDRVCGSVSPACVDTAWCGAFERAAASVSNTIGAAAYAGTEEKAARALRELLGSGSFSQNPLTC